MIFYEKVIKKLLKKGEIPKKLFLLLHHAFQAIDLTEDLNLFDIKKLKGDYTREYFRLRKGKYRAIFFLENDDIYVVYTGKRDEVYDLWE